MRTNEEQSPSYRARATCKYTWQGNLEQVLTLLRRVAIAISSEIHTPTTSRYVNWRDHCYRDMQQCVYLLLSLKTHSLNFASASQCSARSSDRMIDLNLIPIYTTWKIVCNSISRSKLWMCSVQQPTLCLPWDQKSVTELSCKGLQVTSSLQSPSCWRITEIRKLSPSQVFELKFCSACLMWDCRREEIITL